MTPEQRAKIARENGAKSKGPKSDAGKAKSSANAVKTGEHVSKLTHFLPPDDAVLCNEDRPAWVALLRDKMEMYLPVNRLALDIVRQIAIAEWDIARLNTLYTVEWNLALIENGNKPSELPHEFCEVVAMSRSAHQLFASQKSIANQLQRQISRRNIEIVRLERRLTYVQKNYPTACRSEILCATQPWPDCETEKRTQPEDAQPIDLEPFPEPPLYTTENDPEVIQAYKTHYPNRKIIILPPDNVAKGINLEDGLPPAPRNAA